MTTLDQTEWPTLRTLALPRYRKPQQIVHTADFGGVVGITNIEQESLRWEVQAFKAEITPNMCGGYLIIATADGHRFPAICTEYSSGTHDPLASLTVQDLSETEGERTVFDGFRERQVLVLAFPEREE